MELLPTKSTLVASLIAIPALFTQSALASLGNSATSISADAAASHAQSQGTTQQLNGYQVYEMAQPAVSFREYIGPSTNIFAIAWQGKQHPNVKELLGTYYSEFIQAVNDHHQKIHATRAPINLDSAHLHIEIGGHVGAVYGRVWLNDSIPSGVTAKEIH